MKKLVESLLIIMLLPLLVVGWIIYGVIELIALYGAIWGQ